MQADNQNSTDATRGSPLRLRVETRKAELELALTTLPVDDRVRPEIENALAEVTGLLTGNLDCIPHMVAGQLSNWLEANKHVNERHRDPSTEPTSLLPVIELVPASPAE